jgi:hypothetical protein
MAKAFDTVRHDNMNAVYKFFKLGPNFIKMLNCISTGRSASIILDDGSLAPPFKLGTGFPQGNGPSPNQFNIGEQILIFKIEFDPEIRSIFTAIAGGGPVPLPVLVPVPPPPPGKEVYRFNNTKLYGTMESQRETAKIEAFADDNTVMALLTLRLPCPLSDFPGERSFLARHLLCKQGTSLTDFVYTHFGVQVRKLSRVTLILRNISQVTNRLLIVVSL